MSDYLVVGKKGHGKSLVCVGRIHDALQLGNPVATNLNLHLEHLVRRTNRDARVVRLPDRPSVLDLECLGIGNRGLYFDGDDIKMRPDWKEEHNGVIVLDEMATWMNSRNFQDKGRQALLDWFVHSRKLGWDVYFIAQAPSQVDKQLREALADHQVVCRNLSKLKIPLVGVKLPRVHIASVKLGHEHDALVADRWIYRGTHLFAAYDTTQRFSATYQHGSFSVLPPGYLHPQARAQSLIQRLAAWYAQPRQRPVLKPKRPEVVAAMQLPADLRIKFLLASAA